MIAVLRLDALDSAADTGDRSVILQGLETARRRLIPLIRVQQAIRMRSLQIALDSLGTELSLIERKIHPRLETDDLVVLDQELDAALLAAKTAMRFHDLVGLRATVQPEPA